MTKKPKTKSVPVNKGRRRFLNTLGVIGGGLIIGVPIMRSMKPDVPYAVDAEFSPNAFLQITSDNQIHFYLPRTEMGQGVIQGLTMLVAEELNVLPESIMVHLAGAHEAYNNSAYRMQVTGGSTSMKNSFLPLRQAAANAREALRQAAAGDMGVPVESLELVDGQVLGGTRSATYGAFAELAAELAPVKKAPLKPQSEWRFIGTDRVRLDATAKTDGTTTYGIDVDFDGLKRAVVKRCPVNGGSVKTFDATAALEMPGVLAVFAIFNGVAVVAESYWQARQAADAVEADWELPELATWSSDTVDEALKTAVENEEGDKGMRKDRGAKALVDAAQVVSADYQAPYLAHATMEPMNCTVRLDGDSAEVWAPTQAPDMVQGMVAFHTGIKRANIKVNTMTMGGGFGRRAYSDFVVEATIIARESGHPIQVVWSREDDMKHDFYRPASYVRMQAGLDQAGQLQTWSVKRAGPNILNYLIDSSAGAIFPSIIPDGVVNWGGGLMHGVLDGIAVDPTTLEGSFEDYDAPNKETRQITVDPGLRTGFWRSVGHSFNGFAKESFMDELALAAGQDPLEYRLSHLAGNPRLQAVVQELAAFGQWGRPSAPGHFQGIAAHTSFDTAVAQIAEVSVSGKIITVHRVACVVDCGLAVNPAVIRAQMESGIIFGLSAALYGQIDLVEGVVQQNNFHDYPVLRMSESPEISVHIMNNDHFPSGVGEPGLPPIAPAVANAVFAATGQRLRQLPLKLA